MKTLKTLCIAIALCMLLTASALADALSVNGTVATLETQTVYADVGGTAETVPVVAGQRVQAGDVLATLATTRYYAPQDGVITGVFGQPGDSADTVTEVSGAVMYLEGTVKYTVSASISNAYESAATQFVRVGETVYLRCYSDGQHKGTGQITAVSGTSYTVSVLTGDFLLGETVNIFREDTYKAITRVGRGSVSRVDPVAVTGTGALVRYAVASGDSVSRGDLLFETLEGTFAGYAMTGCDILSPVSGVVAEVSAAQGAALAEGGAVATIYPESAVCVQAEISEYDLAYFPVGAPVSVELVWQQGDGELYDGTVLMVSALQTASETTAEEATEASYALYVGFTPDDTVRYGMNAIVSTIE